MPSLPSSFSPATVRLLRSSLHRVCPSLDNDRLSALDSPSSPPFADVSADNRRATIANVKKHKSHDYLRGFGNVNPPYLLRTLREARNEVYNSSF